MFYSTDPNQQSNPVRTIERDVILFFIGRAVGRQIRRLFIR